MNPRALLILIIFCISSLAKAQSEEAIDSLALRITEGTSKGRIVFRIVSDLSKDENDWFRISAMDNYRLLIEGNNNISLATGFNHYLKYVANIHICWNNLTQKLPDKLTLPSNPIVLETSIKKRYYLNYCTFSYSMPFWDEDRWMKEIDWMALHGINLALSITGVECVWKNLLEKFDYTFEEITRFIPGPCYMAWWLMGNLEGWGGPLPPEWFERQMELQRKILNRMQSLGIDPVLPGYSGMVPSDFSKKTGFSITDTGTWCGFNRPRFLNPHDSVFQSFADAYYKELTDLFGTSDYYSMDPFHEGLVPDIDLHEAGKVIYNSMKNANPNAKWVIQSWQENPRNELIEELPINDLIILDLYSDKISKWKTNGAYGANDWIFCMLLNFGGNVGMHGRFNKVIGDFEQAVNGLYGKKPLGIGATMEGIENNPIMYELLFELPWHDGKIDSKQWIKDYLTARYGKGADINILSAWKTLLNTVYNAPENYRGEGTVESIMCARPSWSPHSASTWGNATLFYSPDSTMKAQELMATAYDVYSSNKNFIYDYIDIARQANTDIANKLIRRMSEAKITDKSDSLEMYSTAFLNLILEQDSILSLLPDTHVDTWLQKASDSAAGDPFNTELYRRNAAMLITVWGDSIASNQGGLHDYSHREWGGVLKDLYYRRWKSFFDYELHGGKIPDFYEMEKEWVDKKATLQSRPD